MRSPKSPARRALPPKGRVVWVAFANRSQIVSAHWTRSALLSTLPAWAVGADYITARKFREVPAPVPPRSRKGGRK